MLLLLCDCQSVTKESYYYYRDLGGLLNMTPLITTGKCGVVMHLIASVCVSLSVSVGLSVLFGLYHLKTVP